MAALKKHFPGRLAALLLAALGVAGGGCESADPNGGTVPTGGQEFIVDEAVYQATVAPVLSAEGCDNIACHGGGLRGSFELSPFDDKDPNFDFLQVSRQLDPQQPANSNILTKPLDPAAGGAVHTAPAAQSGFLTTDDPGYQAILAWILEGELR